MCQNITRLSYYKSISGITECDNVIYVYVTPKSIETSARVIKSERRGEDPHSHFAVGIINPDSETASIVTIAKP